MQKTINMSNVIDDWFKQTLDLTKKDLSNITNIIKDYKEYLPDKINVFYDEDLFNLLKFTIDNYKLDIVVNYMSPEFIKNNFRSYFYFLLTNKYNIISLNVDNDFLIKNFEKLFNIVYFTNIINYIDTFADILTISKKSVVYDGVTNPDEFIKDKFNFIYIFADEKPKKENFVISSCSYTVCLADSYDFEKEIKKDKINVFYLSLNKINYSPYIATRKSKIKKMLDLTKEYNFYYRIVDMNISDLNFIDDTSKNMNLNLISPYNYPYIIINFLKSVKKFIDFNEKNLDT